MSHVYIDSSFKNLTITRPSWRLCPAQSSTISDMNAYKRNFKRWRPEVFNEKGGFYMAIGNCIHVFRPYFGPHQYRVNQL